MSEPISRKPDGLLRDRIVTVRLPSVAVQQLDRAIESTAATSRGDAVLAAIINTYGLPTANNR